MMILQNPKLNTVKSMINIILYLIELHCQSVMHCMLYKT